MQLTRKSVQTERGGLRDGGEGGGGGHRRPRPQAGTSPSSGPWHGADDVIRGLGTWQRGNRETRSTESQQVWQKDPEAGCRGRGGPHPPLPLQSDSASFSLTKRAVSVTGRRGEIGPNFRQQVPIKQPFAASSLPLWSVRPGGLPAALPPQTRSLSFRSHPCCGLPSRRGDTPT